MVVGIGFGIYYGVKAYKAKKESKQKKQAMRQVGQKAKNQIKEKKADDFAKRILMINTAKENGKLDRVLNLVKSKSGRNGH